MFDARAASGDRATAPVTGSVPATPKVAGARSKGRVPGGAAPMSGGRRWITRAGRTGIDAGARPIRADGGLGVG